VPIERWTRAPTPSLVETAGMILEMGRGVVVARFEFGVMVERPLAGGDIELGAISCFEILSCTAKIDFDVKDLSDAAEE
jgi:hypothetical protein